MEKWIVKSEVSRELLFSKIKEKTYNYGFSNVFMRNVFLTKIENSSNLFLYYTGMPLKPRSMYWIHILIEEENGLDYLHIKFQLRPEIKVLYYIFPLAVWLFVSEWIFKNLWMFCFIESVQIVLSTMIILLTKNIGKKRQICRIFEFLKENKIIKSDFVPF